MTDPLIGKKIGQYEIQSLIGQGGMAVVYRAHQGSMKRDVAMKIVSSPITLDPAFMERFKRETQVLTNLEHAHIVPVHDYGTTEEGYTYLVMRHVKGGSLSERIRSGPPMKLDEVSTILFQLADALDFAHRHGVIHRDIKPSNVLLDEQGSAYLADFGLARLAEPGLHGNLTETGSFLGTPTYISPEQIRQDPIDGRSDVYSLGVVLYEMLAGRPPFTADSAFTIMRAHIDQEPPPIRRFRPGLPPAVEAVLEKALQKEPTTRYQTAGEMAEAFTRAVQSEFSTDRLQRPASITIPRVALPPRRTGLLAAGAVTILLVTVLGIMALRPFNATPTPDARTRPATGTPIDLALSDNEIALARSNLSGSFIGMVACALSTDYHASLARAVRARAQLYNLPVRVEDSQADQFRQPAIINSFIAQGAKVIVVCELDVKSVEPAIAAAQNAGVKIVRFSEVVLDRDSVTITFRNEDMGRAVGSYAGDMINKEMGGKANVAILDYPPVSVTVLRADAMKTALLEKAPNVNIVGRWQGGLPEDGERSMLDALKSHPEINVVMSINDAGAYGAVKALRKAGVKPSDVAIISVDAETEARRMIAEGDYFRASVDSGAVASGELAVDAAIKLLAGALVPKQVFLPGEVVTRESLLKAATAPATP
jgi:serine/threonine protein kinase